MNDPHDPSSADEQGAGIDSLGVLGVGEIAEAIVTGLLEVEDGELSRMPIVLSPRSASRASALAERSPRVRVAADNQGVADSASALLLAVPAGSVEEVLGSLRSPATHS